MEILPIACIIGFFLWIIPGAIGGLVTAFVVFRSSPRVGLNEIAMITLGWAGGLVVGGTVGLAIQLLGGIDQVIGFGLIGLITGAIGGWVMHTVIDQVCLAHAQD